MKVASLQRKRRPTKGATFVMHSKTRRRKRQRVAAGAAAGADLGSEVPNLGVARALFVILVLHVAAIAAIFIHNKVTNDDPVVRKSAVQDEEAAEHVPKAKSVPDAQPGEGFYFVATGDSYERIARLKGVDEGVLREMNGDVGLRAGKILRVPAAGAPAPAPDPNVGPQSGHRDPVVAVHEDPPEETPGHQSEAVDSPVAGRALIVEEDPSEPVAVLVKPRLRPEMVAAGGSGGSMAMRTHTVSKGDTVWSISNKYKVSQKELLETNNISDPRKLQLGMSLKVPGIN